MDQRIVILGNGTCGTLVADLLRRRLIDRATHITVVPDGNGGGYGGPPDRDHRRHHDPRAPLSPGDQERELLIAIGVYGPGTVRPPDGLGLPAGVAVRRAATAAVDPGRREVRLVDGAVLRYDALVVAGEAPGAPAPADIDPRTSRARFAPDVFRVRGDGNLPGAEALSAAGIVAGNVLRHLAGQAPAAYDRHRAEPSGLLAAEGR